MTRLLRRFRRQPGIGKWANSRITTIEQREIGGETPDSGNSSPEPTLKQEAKRLLVGPCTKLLNQELHAHVDEELERLSTKVAICRFRRQRLLSRRLIKIGLECADGTVTVKEAARLGEIELNRRQEAAKLADEIRRTRKETGMSQSKIGEMFGVSQPRVSQVISEKDDSSSSLITIKQECEATGKSKQTIDRQRKLKSVSPALYEEVVAGNMTLNKACVAAKIVKNKSPLEQILKLLPKCSAEEIQQTKDKIGN